MKTFLMFKEGVLPENQDKPWGSDFLKQDLELAKIIDTMADGDAFLRTVCENTLLFPLKGPEEIIYRQDILKDCISNEPLIRNIYDIVVKCVEKERRESFWFGQTNPELVLYESVKILRIIVDGFRQIHKALSDSMNAFTSSGFRKFLEQLNGDLNDSYLKKIEDKLESLSFPHGVSVCVGLGPGNASTGHILLGPVPHGRGVGQIIPLGREKHFTYNLPSRDEAGAQAIADIRSESVSGIVGILRESAEDVLLFLKKIREELAFYVGCLNLYRTVTESGGKLCFPVPDNSGHGGLKFEGLYELSLRISSGSEVVSNSMDATGKELIIITGANRGGKSTFLRSLGQAQLMFQCGMYVPAESYTSDLRTSLFAHFKREEDRGMTMGKLDEELARMSSIVQHLSRGSMVLFNESFSSTNTGEGSEISRNIVSALLEIGVRVFFVTHNYDFASRYQESYDSRTLFLKAERSEDGTRTYRIIEGEPSETGHSIDLYEKIFGEGSNKDRTENI